MVHRETPYILWFDECTTTERPLVGGKNASLGEMTRAGIRVPPGFAITTGAYRDFVDQAGIGAQIQALLDEVDYEDVAGVEHTSKAIRQLMGAATIPAEIEGAIVGAYEELCSECCVPDLPVAVRSSATAEDLPGASFAGQQDTTLWVRSGSRVVIRAAICWSSLFTARAISYRHEMGFRHDRVYISVGVQKMANAQTAGVMFTLNPINGDRSIIAIDSSWGLGESVVSGVVTPDNFLVDKVTLDIVRRTASKKMIEYEPNEETQEVEIRDVQAERQTCPSLNDEEIMALSKLGKRIEGHYGTPQDIEWAIDRDLPFPENVMIVQSRPETVWSQKERPVVGNRRKAGVAGVVDTLLAGVRVKPTEQKVES
ncbi:MAG: PEP/pyruvate-binding domain-containing protein [Anaerolineales bacterium]|jgi:pyruvate,water dikinase|nr:PEP/pyruvate-binding domain-containing protein [Anaerolineales bacterium]MDP7645163.1 PEP/pyruvate-binding domain-containing protein [Anaerolineales bacterium]|tara:strand:+ start:41 stop:1150 length:1110 start_codon:yes stop_codon:yes gene_type:complete